jgi:tripartite-type tricarboxylate transporter receptor subunit TctC
MGFATWGGQRLPDFPAIPTLKESGYDVEYYLWTGFFAPRNVPAGVFKSLRDATRQAAQDPDFIRGMQKIQTPVAYQDADEFKAWWDKDAEKIAVVVKRIGKVTDK